MRKKASRLQHTTRTVATTALLYHVLNLPDCLLGILWQSTHELSPRRVSADSGSSLTFILNRNHDCFVVLLSYGVCVSIPHRDGMTVWIKMSCLLSFWLTWSLYFVVNFLWTTWCEWINIHFFSYVTTLCPISTPHVLLFKVPFCLVSILRSLSQSSRLSRVSLHFQCHARYWSKR